MRPTMDSGGRVVIPKEVRTRWGWISGQEFEIHEIDGQLVLEPPTVAMRAERRGETIVAVTDQPMPLLTARAVRDALEQIRQRTTSSSSVVIAALSPWHESHDMCRAALDTHPGIVGHAMLESFSI